MSAVCELCEKAPKDGDDIFCALCRIECEAMMMVVPDVVEHVLSAHQHLCALSGMDSTMCLCGTTFKGGPAFHRRHVAELIHEALELDPPLPWYPAALEIGEDS